MFTATSISKFHTVARNMIAFIPRDTASMLRKRWSHQQLRCGHIQPCKVLCYITVSLYGAVIVIQYGISP